MTDAAHVHCFVPGTAHAGAPLILLHGSGGRETDLLPLAEDLAAAAPRFGIRGAVAMEGGYAFFHRFPDRRVDEADVAARAPVLADFIESICADQASAHRPIAIGFSNGAIMAAALLLTRPKLLAAAVLFRPLMPFTQELPQRLDDTPVLVIEGDNDTRRSPGDGMRVAVRLQQAGALVTHHALPVGHGITAEDRRIATEWLQPVLANATLSGRAGSG
jgi:phospholipase/carboxylesterase